MAGITLMGAAAETVLQSILLPGLEFGAPEEMYARLVNDGIRAVLRDRTLVFSDRGRVTLDTFFNGLTLDVWRGDCAVDDLHLVLEGSGHFVLRVGVHRIGHGSRWLDDQVIELTEGKSLRTELKFWRTLDGGMLYISLEAMGPAILAGGYFATTMPPVNEVSLGIVITHFDRKHYLLPAVKRLRASLLNDPRYDIELVVVDNSRSISAQEAAGITVLPNMNYGGSGGFMKGLLYLKNQAASHCLFMDDDASCETDSIKRAYALMQYAQTEKFSVAGSLLRELEPYRLFEKGSNFNGMCRPQKNGLDMRDVKDLLYAELLERKPDYGGWWFFAFTISDVEHFSFPFFIRGDDIQFAMTNRLDIRTINGVASWAEDFGLKSGPLPIYLDVRSHLAQRMCVLSSSLPSALRMILRFFLLSLFSYNYSTAQAVTIAVRDVCRGPDFWIDNLDMTRKRAEINALTPVEKPVPIDRASYDARHRPPEESRWRHLLRRLTVNGFLLPSFLLKDAVVFQHKDFCGSLSSIYRFKKIFYGYEPLGLGYVAQHDKRRFFVELFEFAGVITKFVMRYGAIKRRYVAAFPEMTSAVFWQKVYANDETLLTAVGVADVALGDPADEMRLKTLVKG